MKKILLVMVLTLLCVIAKEAQAQRYYIIVSSSTTKIKAAKHLEKLRATGFTDSGMLYFDEARSYRVYFSSFESEEKAIQIKNKYKSKFEGAWIFTSLDDNADIAIKTENIELTDLSKSIQINQDKIYRNTRSINALERQTKTLNSGIKDIEQMQDSIRLLNDKINTLYDYLLVIEENSNANIEKLDSINDILNENKYLRKNDTINFARRTVPKGFDFGDPVFAVSGGLILARIISKPDQMLANYLEVDVEALDANFYGVNLAFDYYINQKISIGVGTSAFYYLNSSNNFFFPGLNIKYSYQIKEWPLKIQPKLGLGTDLLMGKNFNTEMVNYLILSPAVELEYGINRNLSLFGKATYFNNLSLDQNKYSNFQYGNFSFGIRYNHHRKKNVTVEF